MTRKRHTEKHIIAVLKDAQAGVSVQDLCRKHGISDAIFYQWRTKYAGLEVNDVKKLRQREDENRRLKQMVAEQGWTSRRYRRSPQKIGKAQGETDCRHVDGGTLWVEPATGVSVSGADRNMLRYQSRRSDDQALRARRREIAETKRRDGCPRIYVRLRREGWRVNHKKVERAYREEGLSLRRQARKKAMAVPRVALPLPSQPGLCYAMDFVHDRLANGRRFKCLTMTELCSKDVPVIEVDASIWRGAGLPHSGPALYWSTVAGDRDPGQRTRILRNRVGLRGPVNTGCGCTSSNRGSRSRTHLLKASTASFEMSA